jgi:hypothetical protein
VSAGSEKLDDCSKEPVAATATSPIILIGEAGQEWRKLIAENVSHRRWMK